jgi:choline/glycine/proline betaine transport protein
MYALNLTINNWAIAAWAPYLVVAICMGLAGHRFKLPLTFRSCLYPIFREYTWGWIGDVIDGFTIVVTGTSIAQIVPLYTQASVRKPVIV